MYKRPKSFWFFAYTALHNREPPFRVKIGIVSEYFSPTIGGITENIHHFARELLHLGHDFRIITGGGLAPKGIEPSISDRIRTIGRSIPVFSNGSCGRATYGFGLTRKMKRLLAEEQFDLLHLHSPTFPALPHIAIMQANAPMVGTFHTCMGNDIYYRLFRGTVKPMLERLSGRIAVSRCCAEENHHYMGLDFDVIPNGVDVGWWARGKRIPRFDDGRVNVLFLGRPDTRNGLDTLIRAFSHVHPKRPNARLIIVGDGPLRFYFENLVPAALREHIVFVGTATDERADYLATADVFVFTPTIASFGITIIEGMSAGRAIIASDIEAFRELTTHEESALHVPPQDEAALEAAIVRLIDDEELRAKLGSTAALRVERYDWKRVTKLHLEYYEQILGE